MKSRLLCALLLLVPPAAAAANDVRIVEIGLKGYYSSVTATPVRIQVSAPTQTRQMRLDFTVTNEDSPEYSTLRTDHFSKQVSVQPGETIELELPIVLASSNHSTLELSASDPSGVKIGTSSVTVDPAGNVTNQWFITILCQDRRLCDEAQSQISFGSSAEETTEKNKTFRFVTLAGPREQWWDYSAVRFLVVADSMRQWSPEEKSAIEYYLRSGGNLLLLEKEADDSDFLAPYRTKPLTADPLNVGQGKLYRLAGLHSKELTSLFSGSSYRELTAGSSLTSSSFVRYSGRDWLRGRFGVSFDFPRLRWVLIWLGSYVVIVGLLNFTLLRRWRRLEWGWITTTCIAALFAGGLYIASSLHRPKQVGLDDVVIYRMDGESPVAYEQIGLRVSSPDRMATSVSVGNNAVLDAHSSVPAQTSNAEFANEITNARRVQPGWRMSLGPPAEIDLSLLRWSFVDLDLQTFRVFSGPVVLNPNLQLKNNTGQNFQEAMYLDFERNHRYMIPGLAPGQEVDLARIAPTAIWRDVVTNNGQSTVRQAVVDPGPDQGPLPLKAIPYTAFPFGTGKHFFVGMSDGPLPDTNLAGQQFVRHNVAFTIIRLDQP